MTTSILSACGAFISSLCVIVLLTAFTKSGEGLFALMAIFFAGISIAFAGYGIDGTQLAEALSNFFAEKGGEQ